LISRVEIGGGRFIMGPEGQREKEKISERNLCFGRRSRGGKEVNQCFFLGRFFDFQGSEG